ncbi:hypothetical protein D5R81_04230 [Parashewanella spongiae]|uniref:Uncharacterized protein n=1 Tax=Parashewanella spongiae TaxID=342950 RepID=A0A3A6U3N7_9GAMM|nr:hypothetical protein [Parashewanella spongiae]MCL1077213.1 hypothetical protein [Parashewanella spongiae]RJY18708.1 hypothetical protein D5R81_04230 [Parashewanella spongiae]
MKRLKEAQEHLQSEIEKYNKKVETKTISVDDNNEDKLTSLLNLITLKESKEHRQKGKNSKDHTKLKSAIADVLLLLDGFDLKEKKLANAQSLETSPE